MAGVTPSETSSASPPTSSTSGGQSAETTLDLSGGALVPRSRETKVEKAARLLVTGRLRVFQVDRSHILAEVKGDSGELYRVGWNGRWYCSCPARTDCSHLMALQSVTAVVRP